MNIKLFISLALLSGLLFVGCGDAPSVNTTPDGGSVDECMDEAPTSTCGLNGNGLAVFECVDGAWEETGCDDSDVCMDGAVDSDVCGNEGLGVVTRTCVDGAWGDFGDCDFETHDDFYTDSGATFYNEGDSWSGSEVELGEEFTVSMWVNWNGDSGKLFSFLDGIWVGCVSNTCTVAYNGNNISLNGITSNVFHHLVVTVSSVSGMTVYLDGHEVTSNTSAYTGMEGTKVLEGGDIATVKHLSIFDGVLSADEVGALYNYGH